MTIHELKQPQLESIKKFVEYELEKETDVIKDRLYFNDNTGVYAILRDISEKTETTFPFLDKFSCEIEI